MKETRKRRGMFAPPEPEAENREVRCVSCGATAPATEMEHALDMPDTDEDGVVTRTVRWYFCSEDCSTPTMSAGNTNPETSIPPVNDANADDEEAAVADADHGGDGESDVVAYSFQVLTMASGWTQAVEMDVPPDYEERDDVRQVIPLVEPDESETPVPHESVIAWYYEIDGPWDDDTSEYVFFEESDWKDGHEVVAEKKLVAKNPTESTRLTEYNDE